jgi:hypothetical protein
MVAVGLAAAVIVGLFGEWTYAPLAGWDVAALVFTVWVWAAMASMNPAATANMRHGRMPGGPRPT